MTVMIERHSKTVRATHWAVALSGLALLFSGFGELPVYTRYMITELPLMGWTADYEVQLVIHYVAAIVFTSAVFFHVLYHARRREFGALPRRGDVAESVAILKAMATGAEEPPQDKFLAEQRLVYAGFGGVIVGLVGTGLLKSLKNFNGVSLGETTLTVVTLLHTGLAMLFLAAFVAHMAAFVIKANRPLFKTMFSGKVSLDYARHRHAKWRAVREAERADLSAPGT